MHLDEHRHADGVGLRFEILHFSNRKARGDEQDAVGAHRARLVDLVEVDDEILT